MQFCFNLMNHSLVGQRSLEDVAAIVGHQLRALGHTAVWNPANDKLVTAADGINVMVEGFNPGIVEIMRQYHEQGARYLILATEEPTPTGFNHGRDQSMAERQRDFPAAAALCDGILHLVPGESVTAWYAKYAPAAYVELGHAPSLERVQFEPRPEFDYGFYGTISKRRVGILKKLQKCGSIHVVGDFVDGTTRDREMRRAKVLVQIRKHEEMGLVSSSRCNTGLCIGRPVIGEPHLLSKPWDEVVNFSDSLDGFYSLAMMARAGWQGLHAKQFRAFKSKLDPETCVGAALRKIGLTVPESA